MGISLLFSITFNLHPAVLFAVFRSHLNFFKDLTLPDSQFSPIRIVRPYVFADFHYTVCRYVEIILTPSGIRMIHCDSLMIKWKKSAAKVSQIGSNYLYHVNFISQTCCLSRSLSLPDPLHPDKTQNQLTSGVKDLSNIPN